MQRELKFRAWYNKKMINTIGSLEFFVDGQIIVNNELVGCELMQFTGLKDKNGKEIYEGDIVSYEAVARKSHRSGTIKAQVFYSEDMAAYMLLGEDKHLDFIFEIGADVLEIVGNVFEK